jgi:hypothetical protein
MADSLLERKQQLNSNLMDAYENGHHDWIAPDSLWRPTNLELWYNLKKQEPTFNLEKPNGWEALFNDYETRLKENNEIQKYNAQDKYTPFLMDDPGIYRKK